MSRRRSASRPLTSRPVEALGVEAPSCRGHVAGLGVEAPHVEAASRRSASRLSRRSAHGEARHVEALRRRGPPALPCARALPLVCHEPEANLCGTHWQRWRG
jgi:hypothetical protein